ncbi:tetratricopeptide repeat protein [Flavihumibacter sp. R14]|nr:tetratricopeptide repeat protein [Flavihumibacter soli]
MKSALKIHLYRCCIIFTWLLAACSSQNESVTSRGMQNLTARYNILYNARELLKESERNIELSYQDNYDILISAYKEPNEALSQPELKKLDDVILKSNSIINDKSQSKYVADAYFLIARANFLKSNFYNATEFFSYIYSSYPKQAELKQAALAYKARSLMNSERFSEAQTTLDTAFKYIDTEKRSVADLYATSAQLAIYRREDPKAASLLEKAISASGKGQKQIRWIYLLAQLQQLAGNKDAALQNYTRVEKSNAPFDMAFNATLNSLSIRDEQSGRMADRPAQLLALLKDDNNLDFADQVYYEIANIHSENGEVDKAIVNYSFSIQKSTRNAHQKGLSYLSLADIYFKLGDYAKSKTYYDSTLNSLSPQYRDFELIRKKANSLELLASRLAIIAREDTLQMLARLPEAERKVRIGELTRRQAQKAITLNEGSTVPQGSPGALQQAALRNTGSEKFYFNNPIALSQGLSDFKRIWGNRKLEDNWRRSQRSSSDLTNAAINGNAGLGIPLNPDEAPLNPLDLSSTTLNSIPLTPELMAESNHRILSAYYDIGNYYREVLNDEAEAIKTYETMLARFPDNELKLPLYYNLYRLYTKHDPKKSEDYKNILLTQYPASAFARAIRSPSSQGQSDEQEAALHNFYNKVYESYVQQNYPEVLRLTTEAKQSFEVNKLSPQLAYLHALALGHTQNVAVLDSSFRQIVNEFPDEKLIVPLVQQHLRYIDSNRIAMSKRQYALVDFDPNEPRFVEEPEIQPLIRADVGTINPGEPVAKTTEARPPTAESPQLQVSAPALTENSMFSTEGSREFYFVVNVTDPSVNLSSSRFGIGQFNRANFSGDGIKHQLKSVNNQNQLIFVGVFSSKDAVADYTRNIDPLMKNIMKVPVEKFGTFFISKENLDKLTDRDTINKYIEFYRQHINRSE